MICGLKELRFVGSQTFVNFRSYEIFLQAEHSYKLNPKLLAQLQHCEENQIPLAIVFGDSELEKGIVKLREVLTRKEDDVAVDQLADEIKKRLRN